MSKHLCNLFFNLLKELSFRFITLLAFIHLNNHQYRIAQLTWLHQSAIMHFILFLFFLCLCVTYVYNLMGPREMIEQSNEQQLCICPRENLHKHFHAGYLAYIGAYIYKLRSYFFLFLFQLNEYWINMLKKFQNRNEMNDSVLRDIIPSNEEIATTKVKLSIQ